MFISNPLTPTRLPSEIRVELLGTRDPLLSQLQDVVMTMGAPAAEPAAWLKDLTLRHAAGDIMIVVARMGRTLAGFVVLELDSHSAPLCWVSQRFYGKGLGQRFYSCARTNLGTTAPPFTFHQDMSTEFASVIKELGAEPKQKDMFRVLHAPAEPSREAA